MNKKNTLITASVFGLLGIILGAFAAHGLKNILSPTEITSFQTGVRYQMYHSIVLLCLGLNYEKLQNLRIKTITLLLTIGVVLFSFSIYLLNLKSFLKADFLSFLGPITPIGGLVLISAWTLLFVAFLTDKNS